MATFKTLNNRKGRAEVAKETVEIIERGFYTIALDSDDATKVEFGQDIRDSVESSQVYLPIDLEHIRKRGRTWNVGDLEVTSENSISACKRIVTEGRTCCLNFASAKNVCGGMMKGSLAQEESLGLCSAISATQKKFLKEYYGSNRRDPKEGYYSDTLIYSPAVPVFRDDEDLTLIDNPYKVPSAYLEMCSTWTKTSLNLRLILGRFHLLSGSQQRAGPESQVQFGANRPGDASKD